MMTEKNKKILLAICHNLMIHKYAWPMVLVWSLYLLAYWPGIMGPDNFDQWRQFMTWNFSDWHPVFHTLMLWLLTRIYLSPAPVAIFQILAMSLTASWGLYQFESLGVNKWILWISSFIFAFAPINSYMVNTLWKDVPYTISLLLCTIILLIGVITKGKWFEEWSHCFWFGVVLALIYLFRHNGIAISIVVILGTLICFRKYFRAILVSVMTFIALILVIRVGVYSLIGVNGNQTIGEVLIHPISAYVATNNIGVLDSDEIAFINDVHPLDDGWKKYTCYDIGAIQWDSKTNIYLPNNNSKLMLKIFIKLLINNPRIYLHHAICNSSYLWLIPYPKNSYQELIYLPSENYYGGFEAYAKYYDSLQPHPVSNILNFLFTRIYDWSTHSRFLISVWRPAIYLYLFFLATLFCIRKLDRNYFLVFLPLLVNTLILFILSPSSMIRYQYIAYVDTLLLFMPMMAFVFHFPKREP